MVVSSIYLLFKLKKHMKKNLLMAVAVLAICGSSIAQTYNPLQLKKGQKYQVETKLNTNTVTEVQGQSMENVADIVTTYLLEVKNVGDSIDLANMVTSLKMNMNQMGQEIAYNSEDTADTNNPFAGPLKEFINKSYDVRISTTGKIPENNDEKETDMIVRQLGDFESSGYGATIAFLSLPKDVKAGTTWTNKVEKEGTNSVTEYTVKSVSGDLATLAIKGSTENEINMTNQGIEMTVRGKGTFTGEQIVNVKTGVIQSSTTDANSDGTVEAMGQEFPTKTTVKSVTTVKML